MALLGATGRTGLTLKGKELEETYAGAWGASASKHGFGETRFANQFFRYEGEYVDGRKHGRGTLYLGNGAYYHGAFQDGEMTGQGERKWPNGSYYVGEWVEGEREGKGVYVDADGYKYEGEWLANKRHGRGRQEYRAHMKAVYTGEFVNGRESGSGRIDWENGDFYSGEFSNGLRHGVGEFACSSGDFYSGHWECGKATGRGVSFLAGPGVSFEGEHEEGMARQDEVPSHVNFAMDLEGEVKPLAKKGFKAGDEFPELRLVLCKEPKEEEGGEEEQASGANEREKNKEKTSKKPGNTKQSDTTQKKQGKGGSKRSEESPGSVAEQLPSGVCVEGEWGRRIVARLLQGPPHREGATEELSFGQEVSLHGVSSARSRAGRAVLPGFTLSQDLRPGTYTLLLSDETPLIAKASPTFLVFKVQ